MNDHRHTCFNSYHISSLRSIWFENKEYPFNYILFCLLAIKLAIQTGSRKTVREEVCSFHVLPNQLLCSLRLPPLLSHIQHKTHGSTSATCASVVFALQHYELPKSPLSLLYMIPACGILSASIY